jgi:hypothetical protein
MTQEQAITTLSPEELARVTGLMKPYNDKFSDGTDNSSTMYCAWRDASGYVFRVDDDFTGSTMDTIPEKDLAEFIAAAFSRGYKFRGCPWVWSPSCPRLHPSGFPVGASTAVGRAGDTFSCNA